MTEILGPTVRSYGPKTVARPYRAEAPVPPVAARDRSPLSAGDPETEVPVRCLRAPTCPRRRKPRVLYEATAFAPLKGSRSFRLAAASSAAGLSLRPPAARAPACLISGCGGKATSAGIVSPLGKGHENGGKAQTTCDNEDNGMIRTKFAPRGRCSLGRQPKGGAIRLPGRSSGMDGRFNTIGDGCWARLGCSARTWSPARSTRTRPREEGFRSPASSKGGR